MTAFDRITDALRTHGSTVQVTGTGRARAQCPAHPDREPSLSLTATADRLLMHCQAGCKTQDVLTAISKGLRDLYDKPQGNRLATYTYTSADGKRGRIVHRTMGTRIDGKGFKQYGDKSRVELYRLPQVIKAVAAGATVYLAEGEEDVHALEVLGVVATTAPQGGANVGKVDVSPLKGADVVAIRDKDPTGLTWSQTVLAMLTGHAASLTFAEAKDGKDPSDHIAAGYGIADFVPVAVEPAPAAPVDNTTDDTSDDEPDDFDDSGNGRRKPSQATILVRLARDVYRLVIGDDGRPYAVAKDGPAMARPLRGPNGLRKQLARVFADLNSGTAPSQSALADALTVLEGYADDAHPEPIHLRVASYRDGVAIDLGTPDGRCVLVDRHGWIVQDRAPVLFRRTNLTSPMPEPIRGSHAEKPFRGLDPLLGLINTDDEHRRALAGWLLSVMLPTLPHPILSLFGEQGTAKSTATKLLMGLVDPSTAPLRSPPRDVRQWAITANASWTVPLDNVSDVPPWLSDLLCKAVTGDGHVDRALYSDDDVSVLKFRRCLAINGISLGALRGDLADRFFPIELQVIDGLHRKGDEEVMAAALTAYPEVFGALLDLLVAVLAELPNVELAELPRMADFARLLKALDNVTGWSTLPTYLSAAERLADTVIDSDPFATSLRDYLDGLSSDGLLCSVAELLAALPIPEPKPRTWPKTAQGAQGALRRAAPALRQLGYVIEPTDDKDSATRRVLWKFTPAPDDGSTTDKGREPSFDPSEPSEPQVSAPKDLANDPSEPLSRAMATGCAPKDLAPTAKRSFTQVEQHKRADSEGSKDLKDGSHLLSETNPADLWAAPADEPDDFAEVRV